MQDLWDDLDVRLAGECNNEFCWTQRPIVNQVNTQYFETLANNSFRPQAPLSWTSNPNEWLSTTDINEVLRQYEKAHQGFRFIGAIPVDFASPVDTAIKVASTKRCIVQELCQVDVKEWLNQGIDCMGIVFNMDAHDEPGSHWTSMYINLQENSVFYYDSFGDRPPPEVRDFMEQLGVQLEAVHGEPTTVIQNEVRHQFRNTECGVYSIYFVVKMLEHHKGGGTTKGVDAFDNFVQYGLNDKQINKYRQEFFRKLYGDEGGTPNSSVGGAERLHGGGRARVKRKNRRGTRKSSRRIKRQPNLR